ncbi:MAG TPA: histidine--tRNA ligase [Methanoregulaceae archaeon]|nr:histidine--tRNA ligase [Methanoregulaceae archaeon]
MIQRPRGTRDFLPSEMEHRRTVEQLMRGKASLWGYREVCTPEFEELELFTARSGQGIIEEMYVFEDKGGRMLALRPEITAAVQRMYLNEAKVAPKPLRWFYFADCFRYERPQKGRYRQFWQFGVELIGSDTAIGDAEVIMLADEILRSTGIGFDLHVGHLSFMKSLLTGLPSVEQRDAMRYLDKKDYPGLKNYLALSGKEDLFESLSVLPGCRTLDEVVSITGEIPETGRITEILDILDEAGTEYTLDPGIARGLDYYTGTVFEAFAENLGAENQILGGGAYHLAQVLGGDDVPSSGFAVGFDRVMVALGEPVEKPGMAVGIVYTPEARIHAVRVAQEFRAYGIRAEADVMGRGIGAQIAHASKSANVIVIVGERELRAGTVTLKDLKTGDQAEYSVSDAVREVETRGSR